MYQLFTHFTHIPYVPSKPSTVQVLSSKVSHSFLLGVDTVSGEVAGGRQHNDFKNERGKCIDALGQVIGHSDLKL